ncbi:hypothetical protein D3C71_2146020 [compost metagenome]
MLDEYLLGVHQAPVFYRGAPTQLPIKRRNLFVMKLDRRNRRDLLGQRAYAVHQP